MTVASFQRLSDSDSGSDYSDDDDDDGLVLVSVDAVVGYVVDDEVDCW